MDYEITFEGASSIWKKLLFWFTCFGISFLIANFGWAEQEKSFLYIYIILWAAILLVSLFIKLFKIRIVTATQKLSILLISLFLYAVSVGIILLATWAATILFNVDYYITFQIMSFGACLCSSSNKNN